MKSVFILIQEGGSSSELYIHAHDTIEDADQDRIDCSRDGSYATSEVLEIPASLSNEDFYQAAEALLRMSRELEVVEIPEEKEESI
jgi:hypothetical protein